ncbi:hypothetical protein FLM48_18235 [Shewanella sp. Scap07]|uniref:hypothetical protein n=1 Tax=Shewanella sp. Scap07 TaxID=2589987 RepID=UPI0015BABB2C|nr:hypothetical protein [Shewanella sp. Scap07]QLE86838.1 hypothetical protein FLM48_18235 [Shewanella sp. Scap07]
MAVMLMRVLTLTLLLTLVGCGDDRPEKISQYQGLAKQRIDDLGNMLDNGQVRNANLLTQYSDIVAKQNSELSPLLSELAKDSTSSGPLYQSLQRRLSELSVSSNFIDLDQQLAEAENLYQAADPSLFNDMLSDPVNVVADMSQGALARVNSISREAAVLANGAEDFGAGSQLVGNPSYGEWQTGSNGMSFWAWYGMYSMFSNLVRGPVHYDRWSSRRNYSYYNDVGRYRYTSPKQARSQNSTFERTQKQFSRQGKRFDSPYAKSRSGSTSLSRQSASVPKASTAGAAKSSKFRSNYAKNSNLRNSSSRTTRGVRRGK